MEQFFKVIASILAVLATVTSGINTLFNGDIYPYEAVTRTVGIETLTRTQGVTNDGECWYFSGKSSLIRVDIETGETLGANLDPYAAFEEMGIDHIGGISYYNGYIYAGLEDSHVFDHPVVALYDAETLAYTGIMRELDTDMVIRGCPWVCCDPDRGVFYIANSDDSRELFCYSLDSLEYVETVELKGMIDEIQGAEMYRGIMYAATNDPTRAVYAVNPDDGTIEKYFDRIMYKPVLIENLGGEGQDITVLEMEDGTVFHALDLGALFIDSNLRHYKPVEE